MIKKEKIWLYLDDVRVPTDSRWEVVKNYDEFVAHIKMNRLDSYEVISLDHDLGDTAMNEYYNNVHPNYTLDYNNIVEKTGMDCAKWLVAESMTHHIPLPQIYVHSANPIGSANIMGYINNYLMNSRLPQTCIRIKVEHSIPTQIG
jgi:hypothetical protein